MQDYHPITRIVVRSFKYIFEEKDDLLEYLLISIDETGEEISEEEIYRIIDILLLYYSAAGKEITEEDILRKLRQLEGKGERIMTILQAREQKGLEQGLEQGMLLGELKREKELVKALLGEGVSIEIISKTSKLSMEEIEQIKRELNH